jgi:hypothetical protein
MKILGRILIPLFILNGALPLRAAEPMWKNRDIQVIDIPTAEVVDHYGYHVSFRFGSEGALQSKTSFGIFPRLNLGFGLDGERVLGTQDARLNKPTINIKFRLFDGRKNLPALALGFDGQGYVFNRTTDEYEQREKGLYLVSSTEFLFPDLLIHIGGNIFDFDEGNSSRGFGGLSYNYEQTIGLMFEYDHATEYNERRVNFGARYFVTPVFTVDAIGRNIPETPGSSKRETERIVKLNYTGSF